MYTISCTFPLAFFCGFHLIRPCAAYPWPFPADSASSCRPLPGFRAKKPVICAVQDPQAIGAFPPEGPAAGAGKTEHPGCQTGYHPTAGARIWDIQDETNGFVRLRREKRLVDLADIGLRHGLGVLVEQMLDLKRGIGQEVNIIAADVVRRKIRRDLKRMHERADTLRDLLGTLLFGERRVNAEGILASDTDIDAATYQKMRGMSYQEVLRTNGQISFPEVLRQQRRW